MHRYDLYHLRLIVFGKGLRSPFGASGPGGERGGVVHRKDEKVVKLNSYCSEAKKCKTRKTIKQPFGREGQLSVSANGTDAGGVDGGRTPAPRAADRC